MDPVTTYALIQAGTAAAKWGYNKYLNKQPSFDNTTYGKRLKKRSTFGAISPLAADNILANTSKVAGQGAANNVATYQGRLANMGLLNSVAGVRGEADIRTAGNQVVANKAADIATQNAITREQAKDEYAFQKGQYQEGVRQFNQQNNANLVNGVLDAAGSYAASKLTQPSTEGLDINNPDSWAGWVAGQPNQEQALSTLRNLSMAKYYGQRWDSKGNKPFDFSQFDNMDFEAAQDFYIKNIGLMSDLDMEKAKQIIASKVK